jgi:glycine/D-amino acid oxidase-like deaminating enzyme
MRPDGGDGHYLVGGRGGRPDDALAAPETATRGADADRLADFERELAWRLPATTGGIWRGSWSSFYDFTPDGNPVVDRVPGHERLIVATGGSGHAFKLAPALGLAVAELHCDGDVQSFDWSGLRFGRFG